MRDNIKDFILVSIITVLSFMMSNATSLNGQNELPFTILGSFGIITLIGILVHMGIKLVKFIKEIS